MKSLQETVNNVIDKIEKRNLKIKGKINDLQTEAVETKANIDRLMRELVDYELNDNTKAYTNTEKEITKLRAEYENLNAKINAYSELLNNADIIRDELPAVFDSLHRQQEIRSSELQSKTEAVEKARQNIRSLQEQITKLTNEIQLSVLYGNSDKGEVMRILKCIESRQIEEGRELAYLEAFSKGIDCEKYLVQKKTVREIPYQQHEEAHIIEHKEEGVNVGYGPNTLKYRGIK